MHPKSLSCAWRFWSSVCDEKRERRGDIELRAGYEVTGTVLPVDQLLSEVPEAWTSHQAPSSHSSSTSGFKSLQQESNEQEWRSSLAWRLQEQLIAGDCNNKQRKKTLEESGPCGGNNDSDADRNYSLAGQSIGEEPKPTF